MSLTFFLDSFLKQPLDLPYFSQEISTLFYHLFLLIEAYEIQVKSNSIGNQKEIKETLEELLLKSNKIITKLLSLDIIVDIIKKKKNLTKILNDFYMEINLLLRNSLYIFNTSSFLSYSFLSSNNSSPSSPSKTSSSSSSSSAISSSLISSANLKDSINTSKDSLLISNFLILIKNHLKNQNLDQNEHNSLEESLQNLLKESNSLRNQAYSSLLLPYYSIDTLDIESLKLLEKSIREDLRNNDDDNDDDNEEEEDDDNNLTSKNIDLLDNLTTTFRGIWDNKLVAIKKINPKHLINGINSIYDIATYAQKSSELAQKCPFLYGYCGISIKDNKNNKIKSDFNKYFLSEYELKKLKKLNNINNKNYNMKDYLNHESNNLSIFLISPLAPALSLHHALFFSPLTGNSSSISNQIKLNPVQKINILYDIILALDFLHKNNIIHGRLTDKNIMLFDNMRVKLADFGLYEHFDIESRVRRRGGYGIRWTPPEIVQFEERYLYNIIENKDEDNNFFTNTLPLNKKSLLFSSLITPQPLTSLISFSSSSFLLSPAVDIYSFGVLVLVLLTEKIPFPNLTWPQAIRNQLMNGNLPVMTSNYPYQSELSCLEETVVRSCIKKEFFNRPVLNDVKNNIKNILTKLNSNEQLLKLNKLKEDIKEITNDLEEIRAQANSYIELIETEKKNIIKLEQEKVRTLDIVEKRKIDSNLFNLRKKINEYNEEINYLYEDEENAEKDLNNFNEKLSKFESDMINYSDTFYIKQHLEQAPLHSLTDFSYVIKLYFTQNDIEQYEKKSGNINLTSPYPSLIDKNSNTSNNKKDKLHESLIYPLPSINSISPYDEMILKNNYNNNDLKFLLPILKIFKKNNIIDYDGENIEELYIEDKKNSINPILFNILSPNPSIFLLEMLNKLIHLVKYPLISSIRDKIKQKEKVVVKKQLDSDDEDEDEEGEEDDSKNPKEHDTNNLFFSALDEDSDDEDEKEIIAERNNKIGDVDSDDEDENSNHDEYYEYQENFKKQVNRKNKSRYNDDEDDDDDDGISHNYSPSMSEDSKSFSYSSLFNKSKILTTKFNFFTSGSSSSQLFFNYMKESLVNISKSRFKVSNPLVKESPVQFLSNPTTTNSSAFINFNLNEVERVRLLYAFSIRGEWRESTGFTVREMYMSDEELANLIEANITPIHLACLYGNIHALSDLIRIQFPSYYNERKLKGNGFKFPSVICTDANGDSPLHYACKRGHVEVVKLLIEVYNQNPLCGNDTLISPLVYAIKYGHLDCLKYFLENSSTCNNNITEEEKISYDKSPITINNTALPTPFLSSHYRDYKFGATLIHWATLSRSIPMIEYLITDHNVSVSTLALSDQTSPLHWACFGGSNEVVKYLIERAGADTQLVSKHGSTCLHFATASGEVEKVAYLIDIVKLKVTLKDKNQQSAFDTATGNVIFFFKERKKKGFVTESITEKKT